MNASESPADARQSPGTCTAEAPKTGKVRLLTLADLDSRTRAARQANALVAAIEDDLGGAERLSIAERQIAQRAAVLGAVLEGIEVEWLAGKTVDVGAYLAGINAQRRCLESLGLRRRPRDVTPDLRDYVAGSGARVA